MQYTVTTVIQSGNIDAGEPVPVQWYKGDNLALAVSAMAQAATHNERDKDSTMPEHMRVRTLSVTLTVEGE